MNEHDFDDLLKGAVPDLPPDDIVREVTPWRRAMDRILPGMALCAIPLNFFLLYDLLPTIGVILLVVYIFIFSDSFKKRTIGND